MAATILAIALILAFSLLSGFNDGGNMLATFINNRTLQPLIVVAIIVVMVTAGPFLVGTAVAETIGTKIINIDKVGLEVLNVSLVATLLTLGISWRMKVPTSTTFALVGGMCGSGIILLGPSAVVWTGLVKVALSLVFAVLFGSVAGYIVYAILMFVLRGATLVTGVRASYVQYISAALVCFGYGVNDAEKSIGLLATVWMVHSGSTDFHIDWWMIVLPAMVFAAGLLGGGLRIAQTVGHHVFHVRPIHALSTQLATSIVVLTASGLGGPVSTTQTIDSALVGVGMRFGKERVRWEVVHRLGWVWISTAPIAFILAIILALLVKVGVHL